ncbi:phosphatase PAP2 family protein [Bradyrhizobium erythrophlei]|uniref:acid phosphatase n=1 Tax=Bradyrhizobium erythrophlei TaxID=1437360 RepID=UPI0035EDCFDB
MPPPPAPGSPAQAVDDEARKAAIPLRESARWKLAARDADYKSPHVVDAFACTIGVTISPEATPHLYTLLRRTLIDTGLSTYKAKIHYNRTRPFVAANDNTICSPEEADFLRKDGSYPSGHSAFGWGWALILAEMIPDKADAIIQRGYDFGQSRVQCGVHWQSDVNAGRVVASAAVAQLHSYPEFIAEFRAAQQEVEAARAANKSGPDCTLEKQATTK